MGNEGATIWTVPEADDWGDNPVEPLNGGPDVAKGTVETEAAGGRFTTKPRLARVRLEHWLKKETL